MDRSYRGSGEVLKREEQFETKKQAAAARKLAKSKVSTLYMVKVVKIVWVIGISTL